ncbi:dsDNA nuclease domain-containing protein [Parvibacter caecicola]|uniref:dsDNA nuclease domain-containing protein n=1 Tax=Parvibacter caecicola TaxID=747645 RepID=UPI0027304AED|nr:dsDNA nuclease domain-containing protein [Parvibacter caecicola]
MTNKHETYMSKLPDMSGSIAKNRFRVELLWGIEKLLDCLDRGIEDFTVVFDYCCDIELHLDGSYEFYQVKTSAGKKFGVSWVSKKSSQSGTSIVGKLYELHDIESDGLIRLVIVGNKPFTKKNPATDKKEDFDQPGELLFSTLHDDDKKKIEEAIIEHLPGLEPNLDILSYILVAIDLSNPDDSIRGHLIRTYESTMNCEARKPGALYRALKGLAETKACTEKQQTTYDEIVANKAITDKDISSLFDLYADRENSSQDYVMKWIDKQPPLKRIDLKCAYEEVIANLYKPRGRDLLEACIKVVTSMDNSLSEDEIVEGVTNSITKSHPVEITDAMCDIYAILALYEVVEKRHE